VAGNDSAITTQGTPVGGQLSSNDSDPESGPLLYDTNPVSGPSHGSVVITSDGVSQ